MKKHVTMSIIIPAYNAQAWIQPTVDKILAAIHKAEIKQYEIIIVDDGSSDDTALISNHLKSTTKEPIKVLSHKNRGRFLTRKRGVEEARYDTIFFIDTRVWIDEDSLSFIVDQRHQHPERKVWNGDVKVAKKGNIIARFGDAVTCIGWRRYHHNPRLVSYGLEDFDYYPKGTGIFIAPRHLIMEAITWFESQTNDIKNSSDDTLMIRYIAGRERIWITPQFSCTYFARTTLKAFINHTYHRGQFFVDGFLRPGTRFFFLLIMFLVGCVTLLIAITIWPKIALNLFAAFFLLWVLELLVAFYLLRDKKDAIALFVLSPVFTVFYGLGIWRAVIRRFMGV